MMVSGMVGSVDAELTIGTSVLRLTRSPMWVVSALMRAEHGPDFIVVRHLDDLVAGRAPEGLVVVHHELEGGAAVAAARVRFFDGEEGSVQHEPAEGLIGMIFDGTEKADADFVDVARLEGDCIARGPVVLHLLLIVLVVGYGEFAVGAQVFGGAGIGTIDSRFLGGPGGSVPQAHVPEVWDRNAAANAAAIRRRRMVSRIFYSLVPGNRSLTVAALIGRLRCLRSLLITPDGIGSPGFRWTRVAGRAPARDRKRSALR